MTPRNRGEFRKQIKTLLFDLYGDSRHENPKLEKLYLRALSLIEEAAEKDVQ